MPKYKLNNKYPKSILPIKYHFETKKIIQYDIKGKIIKKWNSILEAAQTLNIKQQGICNVLKERSNSHGGFVWKYK